MKTIIFSAPSEDLFPVEVCVYFNADTCCYRWSGGKWMVPVGYEERLEKRIKAIRAFDKSCSRETAVEYLENERTSFHFVQFRHAEQYLATELHKRFLDANAGDPVKAATTQAVKEGFMLLTRV